MRIGFFGTPVLSASVLADLIQSPDMEISFVVTNQDVAIGRSKELKPTPVKVLAMDHQIPVFSPERIRGNIDFFDTIRSYECDYFVVVAYGRILPTEILDMPLKLCVNVHGSILPQYRGASPIQSVLLDGATETGVTIMKMSEGMDEGDILKIRKIHIDPDETTETLFEKFSVESGPTLIQTLREYEMGGITPLPQDASIATYCKKIQKEDGLLDWSLPAKVIYHKWQGYSPWPGIYTLYQGKRLLLEQVQYSDLDTGCPPGTVIKSESGEIQVACGSGFLLLVQVKMEGKKSQMIRDFINGNQHFISSRL